MKWLDDKFNLFLASIVLVISIFTMNLFVSSFKFLSNHKLILSPTKMKKVLNSARSERSFSTSPFNTPIPKEIHVTLDKKNLKDRIIIIGDIHGCMDEFREILAKCDYKEETTSVILVGDLVNKGPFSAEVVKYSRKINAFVTRGNHDDFALAHALNLIPKENRPKGLEYIDKFDQDDIEWMQNLPYSISIPHLNTLIVHAGILPGVTLQNQRFVDLYSIRNIDEVQLENNEVTLEGLTDTKAGKPWVDYLLDTDSSHPHVYFGHDAKRGLQLSALATGLDTGCCYGRKLSAIILPSKELVQVDAYESYEPIKDKEKST